MPELPEVESVASGLRTWAAGRRVTGVRVFDPRILGTTSNRTIAAGAVEEFTELLTGREIAAVERRGKFLWLPLAPERGPWRPGRAVDPSGPPLALSVHLGMSGQFRVHTPADPLHRHTRAVLDLAGPGPAEADPAAPPTELRFLDQRIFGHLGVEPLVPDPHRPGAQPDGTAGLVPGSAAHIAPDPLEPGFDLEAVARRIQRKRTALKVALLDQTTVSGIGNIYADEALFAAGVHPLAPAGSTRISRIRAVLAAADAVMRSSLEQGGTSFDALYVHVNGDSGYFARSLQVYGRTGRPCPRCGTPITRLTVGGRSSHVCPRCQRPPRRARIG
ncbi:formamidopyrimidine-DNA glycosylase [Brevibacterium pityocampae]